MYNNLSLKPLACRACEDQEKINQRDANTLLVKTMSETNNTYQKKVEIGKILTWCADCGRLSTGIPAQQRYRCVFCGKWSKFYLNVRAYKTVVYQNTKPNTLLRK